ncbi:MAG TPA: (5-formylfuran-3-yl)methyl phosphate synthase, partial [Methylomirabilota bacterium]|nr:(5-formylfuran-3-yl)methyl phosphate synthase [Methylomirabilota bacterium]
MADGDDPGPSCPAGPPERRRVTRFLASIASVEELPAALEGGADLIDVKDPATGALGATDL